MRVRADPEGWPRAGQRWKREGEPTRRVLWARTPFLDWDPGVFFTLWPTRRVHFEDWDEWMWWASDAKLQEPRMVRLW